MGCDPRRFPGRFPSEKSREARSKPCIVHDGVHPSAHNKDARPTGRAFTVSPYAGASMPPLPQERTAAKKLATAEPGLQARPFADFRNKICQQQTLRTCQVDIVDGLRSGTS